MHASDYVQTHFAFECLTMDEFFLLACLAVVLLSSDWFTYRLILLARVWLVLLPRVWLHTESLYSRVFDCTTRRNRINKYATYISIENLFWESLDSSIIENWGKLISEKRNKQLKNSLMWKNVLTKIETTHSRNTFRNYIIPSASKQMLQIMEHKGETVVDFIELDFLESSKSQIKNFFFRDESSRTRLSVILQRSLHQKIV